MKCRVFTRHFQLLFSWRIYANRMKKIGLATFVIITFVLYSIHQRSEGAESAVVPTTSQKSVTTTNTPSNPTTTIPASSSATYRDGNYTGTAADALYGYIQVEAVVSGGQLADVKFLQYPNDRRTSIEINSEAMPLLKQQAIKTQNAQVDGVSGATDTSQAFIESLNSALRQAHA